jgi:hypothetical protein
MSMGKITFDIDFMNRAATNGDLTLMKYARENGCPWTAL